MKKFSFLCVCLLILYCACDSGEGSGDSESDSGIDIVINDTPSYKDSETDSLSDDVIGTDDVQKDILSDADSDVISGDVSGIDLSSDSGIDEGTDSGDIYDITEISDVVTEGVSDDSSGDITLDSIVADEESGDGGSSGDTGQAENYDRVLVVTHPYGPDGSACGRNIEFFRFDESGFLSRLNESIEVGDCPIKARFSPDGRFLFVIVNNGHNPQAGTQAVVVLEKNISGKYMKVKQFDEFSMQNPEYLVFQRNGERVFVSDFDIEGNGGIHIIRRKGNDWVYQKEISIALPKAMVVLPDDRYLVAVAGKEPYDMAVIDMTEEKVVSEKDIFDDFVDALGIDVTPDGKYLIIPNSSPYSNLGNTLSVLEIDYSEGVPAFIKRGTLPNVNEPSASLFTTDGKYAVVTNFSKNYTSLFSFVNAGLNLINRVTSMPLADTMTMIKRGNFRDYFFVNALSDIHILKIQNGQLTRVQKLVLGDGSSNMLGDIDIEP
ncbi:MAG: hypothetical protein N3B13_02280 [Deltaproteobacteria bacterium]|nr:hypothetical protein [Deltaproteobacteria bacterium]